MEMTQDIHQCYETFTYPRFIDRGEDDWVNLIVQDLTETVGHSPTEKRLLHVMLEGPGDLKFMYDMALDYLGTFITRFRAKRRRKASASVCRVSIQRRSVGFRCCKVRCKGL